MGNNSYTREQKEKAKDMLRHSTKTATEIAMECKMHPGTVYNMASLMRRDGETLMYSNSHSHVGSTAKTTTCGGGVSYGPVEIKQNGKVSVMEFKMFGDKMEANTEPNDPVPEIDIDERLCMDLPDGDIILPNLQDHMVDVRDYAISATEFYLRIPAIAVLSAEAEMADVIKAVKLLGINKISVTITSKED